MPIKTGRADDNATIRIDHERCNACGLCVKICPGGPLFIEDRKVHVDYSRGLGCIGCGHCAAVCPQECIVVEGRDLLPADILPLPPRDSRAGYDRLLALLRSRRSVRHFQHREVDQETIDKILNATLTAPVGIPPSDTGVLVFRGRDKVDQFRRHITEAMKHMQRFFAGPLGRLLRPLFGKEMSDTVRTFLLPALRLFLTEAEQGRDLVAHGAPLGMLFYGSLYGGPNPADPLIAATYAVIAAESLGLGSCMLGFPAPILKRNKKLLAKYGIPPKAPLGIMVVFGYPAVEFRRSIQRRFARVHYA